MYLYLSYTQFAGASRAYAMSEYDSVITNATQLKVSYPGYGDIDVTTTYMGYILGTITDGVAQNDCDSACRSVINDSLDYGDYSIDQTYMNYPTDNYFVTAYFCDQKITSTAFNTDYNGQEKVLYGSTTIPASCVTTSISFQSSTTSNHIFIGGNVSSNVSTNAALVAEHWIYPSGVVPLILPALYLYWCFHSSGGI